MKLITKISNHLKNYLMWYALLVIAVGWILGLLVPEFTKTNQKILNKLITIFVFMMIYPMMINLNLSKIPGILKKPKPIIMTVVYNFLITPILSLLFVKLFIHNPELALGFMLVMLIPGSSMSLGYTGIVDGSMELATVAMAFVFMLVQILLPFFIGFLGKTYNISIPIGLLLQTVATVLILPMIAGDLTRRGIRKWGGEKKYNELKPLFSFITLLSMLFMVTLIFMLKAQVLLEKWKVVVNLALITLGYLFIMFVLMTLVDKIFKLNYGEHMAIAFLSTGKNNGTAIAIAMLAFTPLVAIPAAILPLFQIIFSISYVSMAGIIKNYFHHDREVKDFMKKENMDLIIKQEIKKEEV
jgi:ACR3 family arsenite efflux pump ArsB